METTEIIERMNPFNGEIEEHIQINLGEGRFVSMLKSVWDELQAQKELGGTL